MNVRYLHNVYPLRRKMLNKLLIVNDKFWFLCRGTCMLARCYNSGRRPTGGVTTACDMCRVPRVAARVLCEPAAVHHGGSGRCTICQGRRPCRLDEIPWHRPPGGIFTVSYYPFYLCAPCVIKIMSLSPFYPFCIPASEAGYPGNVIWRFHGDRSWATRRLLPPSLCSQNPVCGKRGTPVRFGGIVLKFTANYTY